MSAELPNATPAPMSAEEIVESFAFFDDWEEKYRFIIDLGKELPELSEEYRNDEHIVRGCQSQVWLYAERDPDSDVLLLTLDSDAHIVRGLIAIVLACYQRQTPSAIGKFDIENFFDQLDLLSHLSQTRGNGLRAMIQRIQEAAAGHA